MTRPVLPMLSAELQLAFADVAEPARQGLLAMSAAVGLRVMNEMMEAELTDRVAPSTPSSRSAPRPGTRQRRARSCSVADDCR